MATAMDTSDVPNMEVPLPFIQTSSSGDMEVNEDLAYVLSQATQPISVIAIVGKYRTGKSYIMNRFFESNSGFNLGPTIQASTKGIWMWARPHPRDPSRTLVLLDTEGLHDVEKGDETHDMKLFTLALLLSNCLVYNAVGALDDVIIQQLHLVTELTEHIKTREGEEENGTHFSKFFPYFFLLLRDFFLELSLDGRDCSADEYMENALKLKPGRGKKITEYNEPRQCIRDYFPRRKCFTMCKPVEDDSMLRHLDSVKEKDIKPEFLSQAKAATDAILTEAKVMSVDGNSINGKRFLELARWYVKCMNEGGVPCISNAVKLLKETECQRAVEGALSVFEHVMNEHLEGRFPAEHRIMTQIQEAAHKAAMQHYKNNCLFDDSQEYLKRLSVELENKYQDVLAQNKQESKHVCEKVLSDVFRPLNEDMKAGKFLGAGGYEAYKKEKDSAIHKYNHTPNKGPMSDQVLQQYLQARAGEEEAVINADKALSAKDKELAKENEERCRQEERASLAEEEKHRLMEDFLRQQNEHQKMIGDMQTEFQEKQSKMMEEYNRDMKEKESEYNRLISEGLNQQAEKYQTLMEEMREDRKTLEEQHKQQLQQIQEYQKQHSELLEEMKAQRETNVRQMEAMRDQMSRLQRKKSGGCLVM